MKPAATSYRTHADLGGQPNRDPIVMEPEGDPFHAEWQGRALAMTLAMGASGLWNIDISRRARETLPDYERLSYYQIWFEGMCRLLEERRLVLPEEIARGRSERTPQPIPRVLHAADVGPTLARGAPTERPADTTPRFAPGDEVRMQRDAASDHTRLPGYARGARGVVERVLGFHVFADSHARGLGEDPKWLYTVVFDAATLWDDGPRGVTVSIDAWEPYLEAAGGATPRAPG